MIKLDVSNESVVILCTDCPYWFGFAFGREEAWRRGRAHELRSHPGSTQATTALHGAVARRQKTVPETR